MQINLTEQQADSLKASCKAFNRLTGNRWSLQKYISLVVVDAVAREEQAAQSANRLTQPLGQSGAAAAVGKLRGESLRLYTAKYAAKGVRNVH